MYGRSAKPLTGRYLSLVEREELAILRAQGAGMLEIGRRLDLSASTISREGRVPGPGVGAVGQSPAGPIAKSLA